MPEDSKAVLERLMDVAALAGVKARINDEPLQLETGFELPGGRSQMVYARHTGDNIDDKTVVTFFSPCLMVEKGFFKGISKDQAIDLLVRNEKVLFARYGIWQADDADMIVASVDQLMETLDPDELRSHLLHVALAADQYEQEFGKDEY